MRAKPPAIRWPVAELVPFACLALGMLLVHVGVTPVGFMLAMFVGTPLTMWYLNWVLDTHGGWSIPLILLMLPTTYAGTIVFGHTLTYGEPTVVSSTDWEVFGWLLVALAVTVALAVINGERHRGRYWYVVEH